MIRKEISARKSNFDLKNEFGNIDSQENFQLKKILFRLKNFGTESFFTKNHANIVRAKKK